MADSTFKSILDAVRREIVNLNLPGISPHSVLVHKVFTDNEETVLPSLPGVVIVPLGPETIDVRASNNQENAIGYPVGVALFDSDGEHSGSFHEINSQSKDLDLRLKWRERIRQRFHEKRLPGVNAVQRCVVQPDAIVDTAQWLQRGIWLSSFKIEVDTRESRISNA